MCACEGALSLHPRDSTEIPPTVSSSRPSTTRLPLAPVPHRTIHAPGLGANVRDILKRQPAMLTAHAGAHQRHKPRYSSVGNLCLELIDPCHGFAALLLQGYVLIGLQRVLLRAKLGVNVLDPLHKRASSFNEIVTAKNQLARPLRPEGQPRVESDRKHSRARRTFAEQHRNLGHAHCGVMHTRSEALADAPGLELAKGVLDELVVLGLLLFDGLLQPLVQLLELAWGRTWRERDVDCKWGSLPEPTTYSVWGIDCHHAPKKGSFKM